MQLRIRTLRAEVPAETRTAIERRVRLALGRHAAGIDRAQVTLSPALGASTRDHCRIRVRLREGGSLAAEDEAEDLHAAVATAAWRLEHRLKAVVPPQTPRRF